MLWLYNYQRISRKAALTANLHSRLGLYRFDAELGTFSDELEMMKCLNLLRLMR